MTTTDRVPTPEREPATGGSGPRPDHTPNGVTEMLLHEELARARHRSRHEQAQRAQRLRLLVAARRAARRAAAAERRARLAGDLATHAAVRLAAVR